MAKFSRYREVFQLIEIDYNLEIREKEKIMAYPPWNGNSKKASLVIRGDG